MDAAVHSLDSFHLEVPDLGEAAVFYAAFGLDVERLPDRVHLRTFDAPHIWARLTQAPRKRLRSIRFGIYQQDFDAFAGRLYGASGRSARDGEILSCLSPDGLSVELMMADKTSPHMKSSFDLPERASNERGASPRRTLPQVRPRRLAHISLFTADVARAIDFYETTLGLRLSDRSGNDVAFMHGAHGSDHHMIALARSTGTGLHHCSWDVASIADVGLGTMQMAAAGYPSSWGVGRHVLGSNYFSYIRDPWNSYAEYSADMDFIPSDVRWQSGDYPGEDSFYQWGPAPPSDFVTNYEI